MTPARRDILTRKRQRESLPWERDMTLCIAAASREDGAPRIVLAADLRVEIGWIGADVGFKLSWLTKNWPALLAGNVASARELLQTYDSALDGTELTESNLYSELKTPAERHKLALCDHHVRMKLGVSYSEFIQHGKAYFSETVFRDTESEVRALNFDCDLIVCGFPSSDYAARKHVPRIFTISDNGEVCRHDNFATIGSGSGIANSVLYQRQLTDYATLERTLYVVYEAMKLANSAPGVGRRINIIVTSPPDETGFVRSRMLSTDGFKRQDELFDKYAPKELDTLPPISADSLLAIGTPPPSEEPQQ